MSQTKTKIDEDQQKKDVPQAEKDQEKEKYKVLKETLNKDIQ